MADHNHGRKIMADLGPGFAHEDRALWLQAGCHCLAVANSENAGHELICQDLSADDSLDLASGIECSTLGIQ